MKTQTRRQAETQTKTTQDKKKKNAKRAKARLRRIRRFLTFVLITVLIVSFARSSFFIIDKINVTGNKKYDSNKIILQTGLVAGRNVFKMLGEKPKNLILFRFQDLEKSIYEEMPYVKRVSIRPSLPKAINIKIQERIPFCIMELSGTSLLVDREGYALEAVKSTDYKGKYFSISGVTAEKYKLGQAIKFKNIDSLENVLEFCSLVSKVDKETGEKIYGKITAFNLSELNSTTVRFEDRITVKFGDFEDMEYKIRFFKQLFSNNITKNQKGTLDFTKSKNPYFVPDN